MPTVKVRIAVAVDPTGHWNATGWRADDDRAYEQTAMGLAVDCCAEGEARYWVEAELQIPGGNVSTVQATVKEA
jgi:hypothetical protein